MRLICFILACISVSGIESAILYEDQVEITGNVCSEFQGGSAYFIPFLGFRCGTLCPDPRARLMGFLPCVNACPLLCTRSGHKGQCYDEDAKTFYDKGELMKSVNNTCTQRNCLGFHLETGKIRVQILTCPAIEAGPGFIVVQDPSKPYPLCCPQIVSSSTDPSCACQFQGGEQK